MRANALFIAAALLAIVAAGGNTYAQDTVPETPPELREFRLDPERARPQPEPQPAEPAIVAPPPIVSTQPAIPPSRSTARPAPARQTQPNTAVPVTKSVPTARPDSDSPPEAIQPQIIEEADPPLVDDSTATQPPASPASTWSSWWLVALGLGFGGIALFAFAFLKRPAAAQDVDPNWEASVIEEQPVGLAPEIVIPSRAVPPIAQPSAESPLITLNFVPEKATISFTALTVRGQLQLTNEGNVPAKDMQFRAGLISASAQQSQVIAAFHENAASIAAEPLGDILPGERIGRAIELSVPLTELQSFPLGDQQLLVPIMIASLTYNDGGVLAERAYVACMIGRETDPPQPKMAPLRLDLGPRSFAPLGQRPVLG